MTTSRLKGFAPLQNSKDLLGKLKHDISRMKQKPNDSYAAFDFFITAEHMLDWFYPDTERGAKAKKRRMRNDHEILQIVSHIANGAKHFEALDKRHQSVESLDSSSGAFDPRSFDTRTFDSGAFDFSGITVTLSNGMKRHVYDLAQEAHEFWSRQINDV